MNARTRLVGSFLFALGVAGLAGCTAEETDGDSASNLNKQPTRNARSDAPKSGASKGPVCTPREAVVCRCEDRSEGSKICNAAGDGFGSCDCGETTRACQPNAVLACTCGLERGSQTCSADGSTLSDCDCGAGTRVCQPNVALACMCGTRRGSQLCSADGSTLGDCVCD